MVQQADYMLMEGAKMGDKQTFELKEFFSAFDRAKSNQIQFMKAHVRHANTNPTMLGVKADSLKESPPLNKNVSQPPDPSFIAKHLNANYQFN